MAKYVCVKPCWFEGKLWRLGERGEFSDDVTPSRHLQPLEPEKRKPGRPPKEVESPPPSGIEVKVNKETRTK